MERSNIKTKSHLRTAWYIAAVLIYLAVSSCRLDDNRIKGHLGGEENTGGGNALPTISFSIASSQFAETIGTANVEFKIDPLSSEDISLELSVSGSASIATDYTGLSYGSNIINIPKNTSAFTLPLVIVNDSIEEGDEFITLTLIKASGKESQKTFKLGNNSTHTLSILDDDLVVAPNNPNSPLASPSSTSQIDLSWLSGGGTTTGFRIAYQSGSTAPSNCSSGTQIADSSIVGTSHSVSGLTPFTTYSFRICAINDNSSPDISSGITVTATTWGLAPPDPVSPVASPLSDTQINLTWASGGGSTSDYRMSYQAGASAPADCASGTVVSESSISGTSYTIGGLTASSQYSFRICAINANPTPDVSTGVTLTASTPAPGLGTPSLYIIAPGVDQSYSSTADLTLLASVSYVDMYITNTAGCGSGGSWESYSTTKSGWTLLPDGGNVATVYAKFRTAGMTESACVSDSINVPPAEAINACTGAASTSNGLGNLYDDGGPSGDYTTYKSCDFTIDYNGPFVLHFNSFAVESPYDKLKVWENKKIDTHLLGDFTGNSLPSDISITHGPALINFYSSFSGVDAGFDISWSPLPSSLSESTLLSINSGDDYTTSATVTLNILSSDPNFQQMYVTNTPGCGSGGIWETKQSSRSWDLVPTDGYQSVYVKFRDAGLHETPCESTSIKLYVSTPVATLSQTPNPMDSYFWVIVGGTMIDHYQYKFGPSASTDCSSPADYSSVQDVDDDIYDDYSQFPNGNMKLCVIGGYEVDLMQAYADATEFQWSKETPGVLSFKTSGRSFIEGDQSITFTVVSDVLNPLPTTIYYDVFGSLVDELSLTGGSVVLPANTSEVDIVIPVLNNPGASTDRTLILGISEVSEPQRIGYQSQSTVVMVDAQRATTETVLDISPNANCAIISPGILKCTGESGGPTSSTRRAYAEYTAVSANTDFSEIMYTSGHRCALNTSKELYCWGWGFDGNLGQGDQNDQPTPVIISGYTWKQVRSGGWNVVCGITETGDLYCWGDQTFSYGAVGNGTTSDSRSPFQLDAGTKYKYVDTTGYQSCAVSIAGELKCWGKTPAGDGSTTDQYSPVVVDPGKSYDTVRITTGGACGITSTGSIKCWHRRFWVDNAVLNTPELVPGSESYKDLAFAGYTFACGLSVNSEVFCFGSDSGNFFRKGNFISTPFPIDPGVKYQSIVKTESGKICGLLFDGTPKCWGLGSVSSSSASTWPVIADTQDKYSFLKGGCGVTLSGKAKCLGSPEATKSEYTYLHSEFKRQGSSVKWKQISGKCGIDQNDRLRCWAENDFKNSKYNSLRPNPVLLASGYTFKKISSDYNFVCGIAMDDSLYCLGIDSYGRWGNGSNTYINTSVATPVDPGETYLDISVTRRSVCGVTSSNKMKCWGTFKDGNLGTGDSLDHFSPTPIDSAESYAAIRSGGEYACGLTLIGEIKCWGYSMTSGGTFTTILQPQTISAPLEVFTQLSVAPTFACAIRSDSRVLCWGSNSSGRLGTGNSTPSDIPVLTADTDAYSSITTGNDSSCGVTTANVTKCWGSIFGWAIYNYPAVYPSPTNSFMANADNFSSYSNYLVGIASDGSLSWAYRNSRLPGFTGATRYFEHVQGLVDR